MNNYRVLKVSEDDGELNNTYDQFVLSMSTGNLLQTNTWFKFQADFSRKSHRILIMHHDAVVLAALVIEYELPGKMNYLYAPCGPVIHPEHINSELLREFLLAVSEIAHQTKAVFLRVDPRLSMGGHEFQEAGFLHSSSHVQPTNTRILPLHLSLEEILSQMKPKTRYNIRLAEKKGIHVKEFSDPETANDAIDTFYALMVQTSARDEFHPHPKAYYEQLVKTLVSRKQMSIFTAFQENTPLASILVSYSGTQATYLHGASDYAHRNLMAPYLVQWRAIQEAKKRGCVSYDFWGIAPENAPHHPWAGVTRFKEGFGGERLDYIGTLDYVFRPLLYRGYLFAKKVMHR